MGISETTRGMAREWGRGAKIKKFPGGGVKFLRNKVHDNFRAVHQDSEVGFGRKLLRKSIL